MKLYVEEVKEDHKTGKLLYLDRVASTRKELCELLGKNRFTINGRQYYVSEVKATKADDNTALGMVFGGILGLVAGAPGVAMGGAFGGMLGKDKDIKEQKKVDKFNES